MLAYLQKNAHVHKSAKKRFYVLYKLRYLYVLYILRQCFFVRKHTKTLKSSTNFSKVYNMITIRYIYIYYMA